MIYQAFLKRERTRDDEGRKLSFDDTVVGMQWQQGEMRDNYDSALNDLQSLSDAAGHADDRLIRMYISSTYSLDHHYATTPHSKALVLSKVKEVVHGRGLIGQAVIFVACCLGGWKAYDIGVWLYHYFVS